MVKLLWTILKDGIMAFAFWLIASLIMIFLWGYTGRMLSLGLGIIFIVSFIGATLKRVVTWFGGPGRVAAPSSGGMDADPKRQCPLCWGARVTTCSSCGGSGRLNYGGQDQFCGTCSGSGRQTCYSCHGSGLAPGVL